MNKNGPVIVIEDDEDDQFILEEVFKELPNSNSRMYFPDGLSALEHLLDTTDLPFLIFV